MMQRKKNKKQTSFTHPVKERIQRDFAGFFFFNAAMQIKEENTKKKKVVDLCWCNTSSGSSVSQVCL